MSAMPYLLLQSHKASGKEIYNIKLSTNKDVRTDERGSYFNHQHLLGQVAKFKGQRQSQGS